MQAQNLSLRYSLLEMCSQSIQNFTFSALAYVSLFSVFCPHKTTAREAKDYSFVPQRCTWYLLNTLSKWVSFLPSSHLLFRYSSHHPSGFLSQSGEFTSPLLSVSPNTSGYQVLMMLHSKGCPDMSVCALLAAATLAQATTISTASFLVCLTRDLPPQTCSLCYSQSSCSALALPAFLRCGGLSRAQQEVQQHL